MLPLSSSNDPSWLQILFVAKDDHEFQKFPTPTPEGWDDSVLSIKSSFGNLRS